MIPEHDGDSWLKYQTQVTSKGGPKNRGIVRNVHHDRANGKEGRVLTLLIYLNELGGGGHTVFPCIGPNGGPPADPDLCTTFVNAYDDGARSLAGGGPDMWNKTGTPTAPCAALLCAFTAAVSRSLGSDRRGLRRGRGWAAHDALCQALHGKQISFGTTRPCALTGPAGAGRALPFEPVQRQAAEEHVARSMPAADGGCEQLSLALSQCAHGAQLTGGFWAQKHSVQFFREAPP